MTHICYVCNIHFSKKANYDRHLLSQKHKKREISSDTMFQCKVCYRYFTTNSNCESHRKACIVSNSSAIYMKDNTKDSSTTLVNTLLQTIQKRDKQINELRKQVEILIEKTSTNNTTNNIQTQNNIENQVIVVNSFGNENIEHITDQIICRLIQTAPFTCVPQLIEKIHFDPEHPENHNIKITNKKMNYAEIVKNNKWVTANKKKVIDDVIQKSYNLLDETYSDNKDVMSERRQERFESFQDKFEDQDDNLHRNIKNDVDLILINGTNEIYKPLKI